MAMRSPLALASLFLLSFLASFAHAQTLVQWDKLPDCAKSCQKLNQAQDGCVPPQAQVTNDQTYTSCFCQSAYLATEYQSPNGACDTECSNNADDLKQIQQWYINFCKNPVVTHQTTTSSSVTTAPTTTSTSSGSSGSSSSLGGQSTGSSQNGSWISTHWKWVLMLIIIFLAIIFFSALGVWLKRRHRHKQAFMAGNVADPDAVTQQPSLGPDDRHLSISGPPIPTMTSIHSGGGGGFSITGPRVNRSRGNTLTSVRDSNGNLHASAQVVWGPHQHQAATQGYGYPNGSPVTSVPPSPTRAAFRERDSGGYSTPPASFRSRGKMWETSVVERPSQEVGDMQPPRRSPELEPRHMDSRESIGSRRLSKRRPSGNLG